MLSPLENPFCLDALRKPERKFADALFLCLAALLELVVFLARSSKIVGSSISLFPPSKTDCAKKLSPRFHVDIGGTLQLMAQKPRMDAKDFDGGAGFFQVAISLWGSRTLILHQTDDQAPVELKTFGGHIYAGCMCCAEHEVQHGDHQPHVLSPTFGEIGQCQVVLIMRSRVFRASRASTASSGPKPKTCFAKALGAITKSLENGSWKLPTLDQCLEAEAGL